MDTNSMNSLFSFITLIFAIYCLYAWYQLRDGKIPEKFKLLPRDFPPEKCLDEDYYVSYMRPRLLIFSVAMLVFGLLGVLDAQFGLFYLLFPSCDFIISLAMTSVIPFAFVVWFCVCLYKIQKELW